jgi:cytochrome d ubiquinol oxidase subunit II
VTAADGILAIIALGIVAYTLLGGADFGGGVWDLLARGSRREGQRRLIATTIGPVWEANHVWLVFVLIGLFSGFPTAFGAICRMLAVPLAIALLGIVLRGAAFVFRQYGGEPGTGSAVPGTAAWGRVFAIASLLAPAALGFSAGAVATGETGGLFPLVASALAVSFCAYLAAVYLCREAWNAADAALVRDFRARAVAAAVVAGGLALAALPVLRHDAPGLADRLGDRATALIAGSAVAGLASIGTLLTRRFRLSRACAAAAVSCVLAGWAVAAYPYVLPPGLTVDAAAGPPQTLPVILGVLLAGFAVTVPSLAVMFRVFSRPETVNGTGH